MQGHSAFPAKDNGPHCGPSGNLDIAGTNLDESQLDLADTLQLFVTGQHPQCQDGVCSLGSWRPGQSNKQ